jgi:hypothetical protein
VTAGWIRNDKRLHPPMELLRSESATRTLPANGVLGTGPQVPMRLAVAKCPSNRGTHREDLACWNALGSLPRAKGCAPRSGDARQCARNRTRDRLPSRMPQGGGEDPTCWLLGLPWRLGAPDLQEFGGQAKVAVGPLSSHQASVRRVRACLAATLKPEEHRQTQETGVGDRSHRTAEAAVCGR